MKTRPRVLRFLAVCVLVACVLGALLLCAHHGPYQEMIVLVLVLLLVGTGWYGSLQNSRLKRRLRREGIKATARLLRAGPTGSSSGNDPRMRLTLAVTGEEGAAWEAVVEQIVPQYQLYRMAPGTPFSVLYDPLDRSKVILDDQPRSTENAMDPAATPQTSRDPADADAIRRAYQEMLAKQEAVSERLLSTGTVAPAKVLAGVPLHATLNNKDPIMLLTLEVRPEHEPAFTGQVTGCLDATRLDRFAPGCLIYVRYESADRTQIALVGSEKPSDF